MTNKQRLIELYEETLLLSSYIELEHHAKYPITVLHPNQKPEDLTEEELIKLITASVTNMIGQLC
ncbi:hypothetical protein SC127_17040 [Pantoea sp. T14]|uniref:hypothetical protein n=1 Tax=Pantoea sp. T14 TaxID=3085685 RepID=UPI002FC7034D